MTEHGDERWLTVAEVAERFRLSLETVRKWIRSGELPALHLGGPKAGYRIKESDLARFIAERYEPTVKDAA